MSLLSKLRASKVVKNSLSAYFLQFSSLICGLASIPAMVHHLNTQELAIWVVASSLGSYMALFDLGIGDAIGRKIAPAVISRDQAEINRWWTMSRILLICMALLVVALGLSVVPWFGDFIGISEDMKTTANHVFAWMVVITGFSMMARGVPGLLAAQDRSHLPPLGHAFAAWIHLILLISMLSAGLGLASCVLAYGGRMLVVLLYFSALVRLGPNPPKWDTNGLERARIKSLFGFSFSFSFTILVDIAFSSLPTIALARFGGTALVPALAFTGRASTLLVSFVNRTVWAFYPGMLQLQLAGRFELLALKHRRASLLAFAVALFVAAGIVTFNRSFVAIIAGEDFFVGTAVNAILAMIVIVMPMTHLFRCFLNLGGSMGQVALLSAVGTVIAICLSWGGYKSYGLAGLLVPFSIPVLTLGFYGWFHGIRMCGFPRSMISLVGVYAAIAACALLVIPTLLDALGYGTVQYLAIWGRRVPLPTLPEWAVFFACSGVSALIGLKLLNDFKRVAEPKAV